MTALQHFQNGLHLDSDGAFPRPLLVIAPGLGTAVGAEGSGCSGLLGGGLARPHSVRRGDSKEGAASAIAPRELPAEGSLLARLRGGRAVLDTGRGQLEGERWAV